MKKILKQVSLGFIAGLALLSPCFAKPVKPVVVEDAQPVAVIEFTMNKYIDFFQYKNYISDAGKKAGGGIIGAIASGIDKKVMKDAYSNLIIKDFAEDFNVKDIVFEELAKFPEIKELISAETMLSTKDYTKIKNPKDTDSMRVMPVDGFKYFTGKDDKDRQKKIKDVRKTLEKKLGAKGFAEIYVYFGYYVSENDEATSEYQKDMVQFQKNLDALTAFFNGDSKKELDTGNLHPAVYVTVRIYDKDGVPFSFPYRYRNGEQVKGFETEKEAKKAKSTFDLTRDYYYCGYAIGDESVIISMGRYDDEAFRKLYTEDLVREAAKNAVLRALEE